MALVVGARAEADDKPSLAQQQSIYAKASVVRVLGFWEITYRVGGKDFKEYVGGMGSGFFISADGFVVTNAHVVEDIKNGEEKAKEKAFQSVVRQIDRTFGAEISRMDQAQIAELLRTMKQNVKVVQNNDIVMSDGTKLKYEVKAYGRPGEGSDVAVIKVDAKDAPNLTIADSDKVQIQDKVLAIGYPGAADMQGLLDDKSQLEATINDGAVSAIKRTPNGESIIQTSVSITHGNSGGPAINEKGEVIGLATFGSRGEVQGFNFLVASSTVKKFVKEVKADTTPSATMTLWRKALDEMWSGDLDQSIVDFEEVATLFPTHSEAPRMLKQARALKKEGKGKPKEPAPSESDSGGGGAGIAVAIILGLGVLGGVLFVVMKKKKPAGAHPGMPMHGSHPPPPGVPHAPPPGMQHGGHPGPHMPAHMHSPPQGVPHYAQSGPQAHLPQAHLPQAHLPQAPMMGGRVGAAPVAKTVAISGAGASQPIAATAFGSMTMGSLTCTRGLLNGQRFSLTHQGLLIGRQPGLAQIVINDSRASGKHVWIGYENGVLVAIDQGTTNGTFVNDVRNGRISKMTLKEGDTVIVSEPDCLSLTLKLS